MAKGIHTEETFEALIEGEIRDLEREIQGMLAEVLG